MMIATRNQNSRDDLDEKDIAILAQLRANCHISQAELGKRVGLSTTAIAARIASLEQSKYLLGYNTFIDYAKVGFNTAAVVLIRLKSTNLLNKEALKDILGFPGIALVYSLTGPFHLSMALKTHSMPELMNKLAAISRNKNIYDIRAEYIVEEYKKMEEFNPLMPGISAPAAQPGDGKLKLDDLDLALLRELRPNANMLLRELSARLNSPISTIKERIAKLEQSGVIRGYVANLNFGKLGFCGAGLLGIKLQNDCLDDRSITDQLRALPNTTVVVRAMGYHDLYVGTLAQATEHSVSILARISAIPGIREIEPHAMLTIFKHQPEFNPLSDFRMKNKA